MVLHLAVAHNWGGGDSHRKAILLLEDVLGMFKPNPRPGLRPRRAPDQYVRMLASLLVLFVCCAVLCCARGDYV